jgi:probable rRNA maturation factor
MIKLQIFNEVKKFKIPRGRILKTFRKFLKKDGAGLRGEISVIFVDEKAITRLNEIWKGHKGSTDVLTFDYSEKKGVVNGEIYICPKVAEKYAMGAGGGIINEALNLFAHGLLHLAGYTHETERKLAKMLKRTGELVEK